MQLQQSDVARAKELISEFDRLQAAYLIEWFFLSDGSSMHHLICT